MSDDIPTILIGSSHYDKEYFTSLLRTVDGYNGGPTKYFRTVSGDNPIFVTDPMVIDNNNVRITRSRIVIGNNMNCRATRAFVQFALALRRYLDETPFFKGKPIRCVSMIGKSHLPHELSDNEEDKSFQGIVIPLSTKIRSFDNQPKFRQITNLFIRENGHEIIHEPSDEPYDIYTLDKATDYESIVKPYLQNGKYTIQLAFRLNAIVMLGEGDMLEFIRTKLIPHCLQIQIEPVSETLEYEPTNEETPPNLYGIDIKAKIFSQFKFDSDEDNSSSDEDDHSSADE